DSVPVFLLVEWRVQVVAIAIVHPLVAFSPRRVPMPRDVIAREDLRRLLLGFLEALKGHAFAVLVEPLHRSCADGAAASAAPASVEIRMSVGRARGLHVGRGRRRAGSAGASASCRGWN